MKIKIATEKNQIMVVIQIETKNKIPIVETIIVVN